MKLFQSLFPFLLLCIISLMNTNAQTHLPKNKDALYAGESVVLENDYLKMVFYKRKAGLHEDQKDGYSWAELYGPDENNKLTSYLGLLEHFGEVDVQGHVHPLRMDALSHTYEKTENGQKITFELALQIAEQACMVWDNYVAVKGQAVFYLPDNSNAIEYDLFIKPDFRMLYRSIRGPWFRVGAYDFGAKKTDAIFPGMEWLIDKEWSSSVDFMAPSKAMRVSPHPRKVTAPVMCVSYLDLAVSLSWDPNLGCVNELSRIRHPQPVFACPNFIDKRDDNLMGLMFPAAQNGMDENSLAAGKNIYFPRQGVRFKSKIAVQKGTSLDAVVDWVQKNGLPDTHDERFTKSELIEKTAAAYNNHFWEEGVGWSYNKRKAIGLFHGTSWYLCLGAGGEIRDKPTYYIPEFVEYYLQNGKDEQLKAGLKQKRDWCMKQGHYQKRSANGTKLNGLPEMMDWYTDKELRSFGDELLAWQSPSGSFYFEPDGRHFTDHGAMARSYRPIGQEGDSVLDFYMTASILLLSIGEALGDEKYTNAAKKALDVAMPLTRPEGGDWWETPLHAPNCYTAGWAALAYYLGYKVFDDDKYKARSAHFLRTQLPFTFLWESEQFPMVYHNKPLFGATGWRYMAWTDRCVHWEMVSIIHLSNQFGFDWTEVDPEMDWKTFQKGVLNTGMRLLADHTDKAWELNSEDVDENFKKGKMDMFVSDTFDPVVFMYGGLGVKIAPNALVMSVIKHKE